MKTIRLDVSTLEVRSFVVANAAGPEALPPTTTNLTSAVSATDGIAICKSCGPCCT